MSILRCDRGIVTRPRVCVHQIRLRSDRNNRRRTNNESVNQSPPHPVPHVHFGFRSPTARIPSFSAFSVSVFLSRDLEIPHSFDIVPTMPPISRPFYVGALLILFTLVEFASAQLPLPDHVVVLVEENTNYGSFMSSNTPFLHSLMALKNGDPTACALFTESAGITHPSQPNYFALFAGDTCGVADDHRLKRRLSVPNLASALHAKGKTFVAYSEGKGIIDLGFARRHNPWLNFDDFDWRWNLSTDVFPTSEADFAHLPTVAFVIPDDWHDMHSGRKINADLWAQMHLGPYIQWARTHNSLFILTWDEAEPDPDHRNHIATLLVGAMVKPGSYPEHVDHYDILRMIEAFYGLTPIGNATTQARKPISDVWTFNPLRPVENILKKTSSH